MRLCDKGHDEVCYEGRECPVCKEIEQRDKEVGRLEEAVESLRGELQEAINQ